MATLKKTKNGFQDRLSLNAGQKYCKMLQWEHFAILLTFIMLPGVIKILVLSILSGCFMQVLLYLLAHLSHSHKVSYFDPMMSVVSRQFALNNIS